MRHLNVTNVMIFWMLVTGPCTIAIAGECDLAQEIMHGDVGTVYTQRAITCAQAGDTLIVDGRSLSYNKQIDWTYAARSTSTLRLKANLDIMKVGNIFSSRTANRYLADVICARFHEITQAKHEACRFKRLRPDNSLMLNTYLIGDPRLFNMDQIVANIEIKASTIRQLIVGDIDYTSPLVDGLILTNISVTSTTAVNKFLLSNSIVLGNLRITESQIEAFDLTNVFVAGDFIVESNQISRADFRNVFVLGNSKIANNTVLGGSLVGSAFGHLDEHDNNWGQGPPNANLFLQGLKFDN